MIATKEYQLKLMNRIYKEPLLLNAQEAKFSPNQPFLCIRALFDTPTKYIGKGTFRTAVKKMSFVFCSDVDVSQKVFPQLKWTKMTHLGDVDEILTISKLICAKKTGAYKYSCIAIDKKVEDAKDKTPFLIDNPYQ
eukprot:NODE_72_length_24857_cov_0.454399.p19 type:complete len:136 gc:universal NODE_72_length_24857_cov_0.454399:785-1192(+)